MNIEDLQRFVEMGLSINDPEALREREAVAWRLSESEGPLGEVLLGDLLLDQKVSYLRSDIDALQFGRSLVARSFPVLAAQPEKADWDWYYLGICHEFGRGTPVDHAKAEKCFATAHRLGIDLAGYEEIWSSYLRGASPIETVLRLRAYDGVARLFAERSANAIALLALGPVREKGSAQHVFRLIEISPLLHQYFYHAAGARHIHVQVEAEMRQDVSTLKQLKTPTAALTLWLIARNSRRNPTGASPEEWLGQAVAPDSETLAVLIRRRILDMDEMKLVGDRCDQNGWMGSAVHQATVATLAAVATEMEDAA